MRMPDGEPFEFWDDATEYTRVYHVACQHAAASDDNPGTEDRPFKTINRAAAVLHPGEKVVVREGVYRECVRPARGGEGPDRMIAYEAAPGEFVSIRGSEPWAPAFRPSEGWRIRGWQVSPAVDRANVWMADLPPKLFAGYNPFSIMNLPAEFWTFTREWSEEEAHRFFLRRGSIFLDGRPLRQVFRIQELADSQGAFWVEDPGLRIHLRLWDDADPRGKQFEVTAREQAFAPGHLHLGYLCVSGFHIEHLADGIPVPQRAALSTSRGHHWIIQDNHIRHANACGMDVGAQSWHASEPERSGHHIIRRNHISDCGICGIAGGTGADHTLVEDNIVEHIGGLNVERIWECAGLKFHVCTGSLFRRNVFRHIKHACGLWLDVSNRNCRITENVFADIESFQGGVYIECSHDLNLVDRNLFWDIRACQWPTGSRRSGGIGVKVDSGENIVVAHNLFTEVEEYAISFNLNQADRVIGGRVGLCRRNKALNNLLIHCPKRILLGRRADNLSDGNLFDSRFDSTSFCLRFPEPQAILDLAGWQEYYGLDAHSTQARIEASFDPGTLELTWKVDGDLPACQIVAAMHEDTPRQRPGPLDLRDWTDDHAARASPFPLPSA